VQNHRKRGRSLPTLYAIAEAVIHDATGAAPQLHPLGALAIQLADAVATLPGDQVHTSSDDAGSPSPLVMTGDTRHLHLLQGLATRFPSTARASRAWVSGRFRLLSRTEVAPTHAGDLPMTGSYQI
jgi:hypothetical protein